MKTLLLVDGNPIMHRSFHALPEFKTKDGTPTNVVYGFFSILYKTISDYKPDYLIICFDTPAKTFRDKIFKEYQAHRPRIDNEFKIQIPNVKKGLDKAGVFRLEKDGYEADDLIGTITKKIKNKDFRVLILSGDKDILQLVDKKVSVITPQIGYSNEKIYNEQDVEKKMAVKSQQIPDLKALMGDPSDNYKGAKGIGPKTAASLIYKFQTIENLYDNLDNVENERIKKILIDNKDHVFLSKKLATIVNNAKVDLDTKKAQFNGFHENLKDFLLQLQMYSLANRIFKKEKNKEPVSKKTKSESNPQNQIGLF